MNAKEQSDALVENLAVRQRPEEGYRRWFVSSYFELIVWYESKTGPLVGFQLCLSRNSFERAFTWTKQYVSSHRVSESFVEQGMSNQSTGILKGDGNTIAQEEVQRFEREAAALDPELKALVLEKVLAYNRTRADEGPRPEGYNFLS